MNLFMIPTACTMFGHAATIAYIKEPTFGASGTDFI